MTNSISNMDDTIDSRDIIERIESLEEDAENFLEEHPEADFYTTDEGKELLVLRALADEASDYSPDWTCGSQLIRESYFEEAMDAMVADCYTLPKDMPSWMSIKLDYNALKQDYTEVDFDRVTYYVR